MRTKQKMKVIIVSQETHKRLIQDRDHFHKVIGGGKWSIDDTINEYLKILNSLKR